MGSGQGIWLFLLLLVTGHLAVFRARAWLTALLRLEITTHPLI
jgi:hypothetical protein